MGSKNTHDFSSEVEWEYFERALELEWKNLFQILGI